MGIKVMLTTRPVDDTARIKGEETIHNELIGFLQRFDGAKAVWVKKLLKRWAICVEHQL
jgi:hypothetical protein